MDKQGHYQILDKPEGRHHFAENKRTKVLINAERGSNIIIEGLGSEDGKLHRGGWMPTSRSVKGMRGVTSLI